MAQKVEGWNNYETWAVALWMMNEEPILEYWTERASRITKAKLMNELKEITEGNMPKRLRSPYRELLEADLGEVDWLEIAEEFQAKARER